MAERSGRIKSPLRDDWTDISWGRMFARAGGIEIARTPVILVHGFVVSSSYMVPTAEILASHCPVYAVDLPGFGKSVKPKRALSFPELADALEEWLAAKGLARVHLVGNSMGCQIIAEYAVRHPARIDRIVLNGPTVDRHARAFWPQLLRQIRNVPNERPGVGLSIAKDYLSAGFMRVLVTLREVLNDKIEDKLPRLFMPVLVVSGEKDPISPREWAAEVAALLPSAQLRVIPGGGHIVNWSMPQEFVNVMRPFLGL